MEFWKYPRRHILTFESLDGNAVIQPMARYFFGILNRCKLPSSWVEQLKIVSTNIFNPALSEMSTNFIHIALEIFCQCKTVIFLDGQTIRPLLGPIVM